MTIAVTAARMSAPRFSSSRRREGYSAARPGVTSPDS
jgi:hypothetical protein